MLRTRSVTAVFAASAIAGAGLLTGIGVAPRPAAAAAGVPQPPAEIFWEGFENAPPADGRAIALADYQRAGGGGYGAEAQWGNTKGCNGILLSSKEKDPGFGCGAYGSLQSLARQLGTYNQSQNNGVAAADNHAVTAWTGADGESPPDSVEFRTTTPLSLNVANRFVAMGVSVAVSNCSNNATTRANTPQLSFFLDDGSQEIPMNATPLRPCDGPSNGPLPASGPNNPRGGQFRIVSMVSDGAKLFTGTQLGIVMRNAVGKSGGNDHAFDDIRIFDATPKLDLTFVPAQTHPGRPSTLTITVTNTSELAAKDGWSFTDVLPAGLAVAPEPNATSTCAGGGVTGAAGATRVDFAGGLPAGQASCTLSIDVVTDHIGTYHQTKANITSPVGVDPPADGTTAASLEVIPDPDAAPADLRVTTTSQPAEAAPGETIAWTLTVRNVGGTSSSGHSVENAVSGPVADLATTTPGCSFTEATLHCLGGPLDPGDELVITFTGTAPPGGGEPVTIRASVTGNEPDPNPADNTATSTTPITSGAPSAPAPASPRPVPAAVVQGGRAAAGAAGPQGQVGPTAGVTAADATADAVPTGDGAVLPRTGSPAARAASVGLGLLLVGALLWVGPGACRRRGRPQAQG